MGYGVCGRVIKKPDACKGCPLYDTSSSYVPDEMRDASPIGVMGQNPGQEEEDQGRPFVGKTGKSLENFLKIAGLTREDVSLSDAIRCRWKGTNDLPPVTQVITKDALAHCARAHLRVPSGLRLWIALGDYGAQVCTGDNVGDWRGYLRPFGSKYLGISGVHVDEPWVPRAGDLKVILMVHPARLFREPSLTMAARADWSKVARIMAGKWPRRPPRYDEGPVKEWPAEFAFDTEYDPGNNHLIRYSMAWGTEDDQCTVVERQDHRLPVLTGKPRVITQYAPADVRHLDRLSGGRGDGLSRSFWDSFMIEDTVWKHSVLWSDQDHDLNYLASIYSTFNRWKHLSGSHPQLYSALDAIGLLEVDNRLEGELRSDPFSRRVWDTIDRPVLSEFVRAQYRGLRVNPERVGQVISQLESVAREASQKAVAVTGWPINVGSDKQTGHQLYTVEGLKVPR